MITGLELLILVIILALVAALVANLGIGGGLVYVPLLLLFLPWEQARFISLLLILTTAGGASLRHVQAGKVTGRAVAVMLPAALIGVVAGVLLDQVIPVIFLTVLFLVVLCYVIWLWLGRLGWRRVQKHRRVRWGKRRTFAMTIAGGTIAPLLGLGGGIIFVPILLLGVGLRERVTIGTSATVILGVVGFTTLVRVLVDPGLAGLVGNGMGVTIALLMAVVGLGSWLGSSIGLKLVVERYLKVAFLSILLIALVRMAMRLV